jgi:hypothetical protein
VSEPTEQQYADPRCSGITKEGRQCLAPFPMWRSPDGRLWCSPHRPQAGGEVERWSPEGNVEALDPERRCLGRMHDGSTQCPAVSTTSVEIDGEKIRICAWHKRLFQDYGVLQPPSKTRRAVSEVEPLPDEDEMPTANGNGSAPVNGESALTLRERVERSTEDNYREIEDALRAALKGGTKPRSVKCPQCNEVFKLVLPDFGPSISAAKLLLELVVSRPRSPEEERPMPPLTDDLDLGSLSTADLYRVAFPGKEPPTMPRYEDEDEVAS